VRSYSNREAARQVSQSHDFEPTELSAKLRDELFLDADAMKRSSILRVLASKKV
jgi:hypothetical protein